MRKKISILCPYPKGTAPSQRFRYEMFIDGKSFKEYPFWDEKGFDILYTPGKTLSKSRYLWVALIKRVLILPSLLNSSYILIHREATPIGPPIIEWMLAKVFNKKIVYDFDDAIWLANQSEANKGFVSGLKNHNKVGKICRWAHKVSVGNEYLAEYAKQYNSQVFVLPTVVDTLTYHNPGLYPEVKNDRPVVGWTGSHSTLKQLEFLWPILDELHQETLFDFHLISDLFPSNPPKWVKCIKWNKETEINDLLQFDIGIMPLMENEWEKGKCAFKLIQYMSLEIVSIASRYGANIDVILNKDQGLLCENKAIKWKFALKWLLENPEERSRMGKAGRIRIEEAYSKEAYALTFQSLFEEVTLN